MYKHKDASSCDVSVFPVGGVVIWEPFAGLMLLFSQDSHPQTTSGFMYLMEDSRSDLLKTLRQFTIMMHRFFFWGRSNGDERELEYVDVAFLE